MCWLTLLIFQTLLKSWNGVMRSVRCIEDTFCSRSEKVLCFTNCRKLWKLLPIRLTLKLKKNKYPKRNHLIWNHVLVHVAYLTRVLHISRATNESSHKIWWNKSSVLLQTAWLYKCRMCDRLCVLFIIVCVCVYVCAWVFGKVCDVRC